MGLEPFMRSVLESFACYIASQVPLLRLSCQIVENNDQNAIEATNIAQEFQKVVCLSFKDLSIQVPENAVPSNFVSRRVIVFKAQGKRFDVIIEKVVFFLRLESQVVNVVL